MLLHWPTCVSSLKIICIVNLTILLADYGVFVTFLWDHPCVEWMSVCFESGNGLLVRDALFVGFLIMTCFVLYEAGEQFEGSC